MKLIRVLLLCIFCLAGTAVATQPTCTGDRHYDGVGCCPAVVECPEPTVCEPVLPCPDPAPCQPVVCKCEGGDTNVVEVDRCPQPEVSEICKVRRNGTVVCPRRKHAPGSRRILVPRSIVESIADDTRY